MGGAFKGRRRDARLVAGVGRYERAWLALQGGEA